MAWSYPSAVAVPSTASYAAPLMDFSWLSNLPNTYRQGQQANTQRDISTAFQGGLPTDAQGNIDYTQVAKTLAQKGDVNALTALSPLIQQQQAGKISPFLSGGAAPAAALPPTNAQPSAAAPDVQTVPPPAPVQSQPLPPPQPQGTPAPAQPQAAPQPPISAAAGSTSVATLVPSLLSGLGQGATTVAQNIAKALGVSVDAPLSADQQQRAYGLTAAYAQRKNVGPVSNFTPLITSSAQQNGLDPTLFNRQLYQESGINPNVKDSATGAQGIAQFEPATARQYGVNANDPNSAIPGAARYMADLKRNFGGNTGLALAAYDWGPGNVQKWLDAGADPKKMPAETRNYVQKITGEPITAWLAKGATQTAQGNAGTGPQGNAPPTAQPQNQTQNPGVASNGALTPAPAPALRRLTEQVPLPRGYNDPQQAIMALRTEAARLSVNPYNRGQATELDNWATRIEESLKPIKIGDSIVSPTGELLYAPPKPMNAFSSGIYDPMTRKFIVQPNTTTESGETLDADAERYRQTGTLPPNMGRGMQGQQLAAAIRTRAVELEKEAGGNADTWPQRWAQFKTQKGYTDQVTTIATAIQNGEQPPTLTGLYGLSGPIRAELQKRGFNLAQANVEWTRAQKQIGALNGPQMTRFVGLAGSVTNTIDEVKNLSEQMKLSGIPLLNHAQIGAYIQAEGNTPNGQLAARYIGAINTLKEEFANLAQGGYAPTESVWNLANRQINENYGVKELGASLDEVRRLIGYRINAIPGLSTMGPGADNRYAPAPLPGNNQSAPPQTSTAPAAGASPKPGTYTYDPNSGQLVPQ